MTKENREKAAQKIAERIARIAYAGGGHIGQDDLEVAFRYGVQWQRNSVWHDANEEPEYDECFIYENVVQAYHTDCIYPSEDEAFIWKVYAKDWGIVRWAYIKDLMPNTEE